MQPNVRQKIATFFAQFPLKFYEKNQILIYADEAPSGIYHVVAGQVRQYDISNSGEELVINVFKQPALFPLSWAINQTPNNYFFATYTDVAIRVAPTEEAAAFIQQNPEITYELLKTMYIGIDIMQRRLTLLMGGCGRSRVIFELIVNCQQFGIRQANGNCLLNIHESELAHRAGLARETVSRELVKLKNEHILEVNHNDMVIKDIGYLEKQLTEQ